MMDEPLYDGRVAGLWKRVLAAVDEIDPDVLDAVATADMITLTHRGGEKVVINTQRAVRQIWVAGKGSGIHFSLAPDGRWLDDKGKGLEVFAWISDCVKALVGTPLNASP